MVYATSISSLFLFISWALYSGIKIKTEHIMLLLIVPYGIFFNEFYSIPVSIVSLTFVVMIFPKLKESLKNMFTMFAILFFVFWVIYGYLQYSISINRAYYYIVALTVNSILVISMMVYVKTKEKLKILYAMWSISILSLILVGWWEVLTDRHLQTSSAIEYHLAHIATATFFNPNDFAYFLVVSIPIIFYIILQKHVLLKITGCFMFLSAAYFIYLSSARLIMLLLAISLIGLIFYLVKQKRTHLLLALLTFFIVAIYYFYPVIMDGISQTTSISASDDESSIIRKNLTIGAFNVFKTHPLGVGAGNLELYMPYYASGVNGLVNAHNFWIELLANYGFIIFIIFVSLILATLIKLWHAFKSNVELRPLIFPLILSILLFIPACIESSSAFQIRFTWFFIGIIFASIRVFSENNNVISSKV